MGVELSTLVRNTLLDLGPALPSSRVITIDTALAHLCAASGQQADLLLLLFSQMKAGKNCTGRTQLRPTNQNMAIFSIRLMVRRTWPH